jgi:hypothetical protein
LKDMVICPIHPLHSPGVYWYLHSSHLYLGNLSCPHESGLQSHCSALLLPCLVCPLVQLSQFLIS